MKTFLEVVNSPRICKWNEIPIPLHMYTYKWTFGTKMFGDMLCYCGSWRKYHLLLHEISKYLWGVRSRLLEKWKYLIPWCKLHLSANSQCKWNGDKFKVEIVGVVNKEMSLSETWQYICLWGARSLRSLAHISKLMMFQGRSSVIFSFCHTPTKSNKSC